MKFNLYRTVNGVKYFNESYIHVANYSSIERQKAVNNNDPLQRRKKSEGDRVARILEIRASDEHHVYARVYGMYWPDELPQATHDGRKTAQGRQPYHGMNELIASNHMDIINVVSVTSQAQVKQMAFDVRTYELSSTPTNPTTLRSLGKSDEVLALLAHLPYIRHPIVGLSEEAAEVAPDSTVADWSHLIPHISPDGNPYGVESLRILTEGAFAYISPPHVVGLIRSLYEAMVLDTELGIIHWQDCPGRINWGDRCKISVD
ncbi:hypothetical protein VTI74DRAFT_3993 [Chaetomium olivicolor]